jgi:hypothetical protein
MYQSELLCCLFFRTESGEPEPCHCNYSTQIWNAFNGDLEFDWLVDTSIAHSFALLRFSPI